MWEQTKKKWLGGSSAPMNVTTSSSADIYVHTNLFPTPHYNTPTPHPIPATLTMALFLPVLLLLLSGAHGQSPASSPGPASAGTDCQTALLSLADCLSYVEAGSNATKPDKACCPELSGLVTNSPQCLCPLLGSSGEVMGLAIDKKKALQLPSVCHVTTPPVSLCSLFGVPVASPTLAPTSGEASTPPSGESPTSSGLEIPSTTGSTPSLAPSSNSGNKGFRGCNALLFIALFFTIFSSRIY